MGITSCAPAVSTIVLKKYPPTNPDSVQVYTKNDQVPSNSESLGVVSVRDGGFTTECDSVTVVSHVKLETGKMGGNAALITEHLHPSIWGSNCHQMTATAMRVNGLTLDPSDTTNYLQLAEFQILKSERKLPHARFTADVGYGWRTAKIDPKATGDIRKDIEQRMSGFVWELSAAYFFSDWSGLSLDYAGYRATASSPASIIDPSLSGTMHTTDVITYVGLAWAVRFSKKQTWIWDCSIGFGYLGYTTKATYYNATAKGNGSTVGSKISIGGEYKFAENWGVGASIKMLGGVLNEFTVTDDNGRTYTEKYEDDAKEGLGQIRMQVGIRYYIK